jgi:hypothetical protein
MVCEQHEGQEARITCTVLQESLTKLCSYENTCNDVITEVTVFSTDMCLSWANHTVGNDSARMRWPSEETVRYLLTYSMEQSPS